MQSINFSTLACCLLAMLSTTVTAAGEDTEQPSSIREFRGEKFVVRYQPQVEPIPLNQPISLLVEVFDTNDASTPAEGISVVVAGWMPEHRHGMSLRPSVTGPQPTGTWTVDGVLFHMAGRWQLFVDVIRERHKERAVFELELE